MNIKKIFNILLIIIFLSFFKSLYTVSDNLYELNYSQYERFTSISKIVRCLSCDGQVIYDSNSQIANDIRNIIIDQILIGKKDDEIKQLLIESYGANILTETNFTANYILLWILPLIIIIILILMLYFNFFKNDS